MALNGTCDCLSVIVLRMPAMKIMFEPMTLGNMRQQGVRSLWIRCGALHCNHVAITDVSAFADDATVPSFGSRMVCTVCGAIGADARPNWQERTTRTLFGRHSS